MGNFKGKLRYTLVFFFWLMVPLVCFAFKAKHIEFIFVLFYYVVSFLIVCIVCTSFYRNSIDHIYRFCHSQMNVVRCRSMFLFVFVVGFFDEWQVTGGQVY